MQLFISGPEIGSGDIDGSFDMCVGKFERRPDINRASEGSIFRNAFIQALQLR
jgi:hypothetical protein